MSEDYFSEVWLQNHAEIIQDMGGLEQVGGLIHYEINLGSDNNITSELFLTNKQLRELDTSGDGAEFIGILRKSIPETLVLVNDKEMNLLDYIDETNTVATIISKEEFIDAEELEPLLEQEVFDNLIDELASQLNSEFSTNVGYLDAIEQHVLMDHTWKTEHRIISDWEKLIIEQKGRLGDIIAFDISGYEAVRLLRGSILKESPGDDETYHERLSAIDQLNYNEHKVALKRLHGIRVIIARPTVLAQLGIPPIGIQLSGNGLPIMKDLTRDVSGGSGYLKDMHIIFDVDETLGYGKKSVGTRMKYYYPLVGRMWKAFFLMAQLVVGNEGGGTGSRFKPQHKKMELTKIERECMMQLFGRVSPPRDENCVIAAHNYWLGRHKSAVFNPNWLAICGSTTIDGLALNHTDADLDVIDRDRNARVNEAHCTKVEYKLRGKSLIDQNRNMKQMFKDYSVGIAWDSLKKPVEGYNMKWREQHPGVPFPFHSHAWLHETGADRIGDDGSSGIFFTSLELIYLSDLIPKVISRFDEIKDEKSADLKKEKTQLKQIAKRIKKALGLAPCPEGLKALL